MNKPKHKAGHQLMRFTRHDDPHLGPASLYGYVMATHDELVETLGKPCKETGDKWKTAVEWNLTFEDGVFANVYSYSMLTDRPPKTPIGPYAWHVGGQSPLCVIRVAAVLHTNEYEICDFEPLVPGLIPF